MASPQQRHTIATPDGRTFTLTEVQPSLVVAGVRDAPVLIDPGTEAGATVQLLSRTPFFQAQGSVDMAGNTKLGFFYAEHSRIAHAFGVTELAIKCLDHFLSLGDAQIQNEVAEWYLAVVAATLLHDIGHIGPGSHLAWSLYFNRKGDFHEQLSARIVREDPPIRSILENTQPGLCEKVAQILTKSSRVPAWTFELISGNGWNVDRGHWIETETRLCGLNTTGYNPSRLIEYLRLKQSKDGALHVALAEAGLVELERAVVARTNLYLRTYKDALPLMGDALCYAISQRVRDLCADNHDPFLDAAMRSALFTRQVKDVPLCVIEELRQHHWEYHVARWAKGKDPILGDLSNRLQQRSLMPIYNIWPGSSGSLKWWEVLARSCYDEVGVPPRYYLHVLRGPRAERFNEKMPIVYESGSTITKRTQNELHDLRLRLLHTRPHELANRVWVGVHEQVLPTLLSYSHKVGINLQRANSSLAANMDRI